MEGTIQLPANGGGGNWSGASFDPATAMLYVPSIDEPVPRPAGPAARCIEKQHAAPAQRSGADADARRPATREASLQPHHRLRHEHRDHFLAGAARRRPAHPPALERAQSAAARRRPRLSAADQHAAADRPSRWSIGGPQALREPPSLRAFDKKTGKEVAKIELALGPSTPMTYAYGGKQYIAMATGGGARAEMRRPRTEQLIHEPCALCPVPCALCPVPSMKPAPSDPLPVAYGRVSLRRLALADLPTFQAYRHDANVGRYKAGSLSPIGMLRSSSRR